MSLQKVRPSVVFKNHSKKNKAHRKSHKAASRHVQERQSTALAMPSVKPPKVSQTPERLSQVSSHTCEGNMKIKSSSSFDTTGAASSNSNARVAPTKRKLIVSLDFSNEASV